MAVESYIKTKFSDIIGDIVRQFLRLDIGKKMFLGYMPLVILILIIVIFSLSSLERLHSINTKILKTDIVIVDTIESMVDSVLSQQLFAERYTIINTPEMLELYFERRDDFHTFLGILEGFRGVEYIETEAIETVHKEYDAILGEKFKKENQGREKLAAISEKVRVKQEELIKLITSVADFAYTDQNRRTKIATALGDSAFKGMVALCIIGTILGIGAALLITHNISKSIRLLREATEEVAQGHFDNLPTIANQDELGDLSRAFVHMAKRLKRLEEMYMDSSPLTRLPGGVAIENVLKKRVEASEPLSFCMLDLDNFKALNDHHGYARGNAVIKAAAAIIEEAVARHGNEDDFVGHIGGDDYVVITTPDKHTDICKMVVEGFDSKVREFYTPEEQKQGYILGKTRQGEPAKFGMVTISIAVVTNQTHKFDSHLQIGELAAEMKEYAKSIEGSVFVVDRRRESDEKKG